MDISKFNSELRIKIGKANGYEKNNMLKEAVTLWIEISEMALKVSQAPDLDFSYRSMLIKKTEEIVNHIKDLKSTMIKPVEFEDKIDVSLTQLKSEEASFDENVEGSVASPTEISSTQIDNSELAKKEITPKPNVEVISDPEFNNLPIGFKQIRPPEDFHSAPGEILNQWAAKCVSPGHSFPVILWQIPQSLGFPPWFLHSH